MKIEITIKASYKGERGVRVVVDGKKTHFFMVKKKEGCNTYLMIKEPLLTLRMEPE